MPGGRDLPIVDLVTQLPSSESSYPETALDPLSTFPLHSVPPLCALHMHCNGGFWQDAWRGSIYVKMQGTNIPNGAGGYSANRPCYSKIMDGFRSSFSLFFFVST